MGRWGREGGQGRSGRKRRVAQVRQVGLDDEKQKLESSQPNMRGLVPSNFFAGQ
jgi:hypothetical protein